MIIVGDNLLQLIAQHEMVAAPHKCFDESCIQLTLGNTCINLRPSEKIDTLTYQEKIPDEIIHKIHIGEEGLVISPKSSILASSAEKIYMPKGYMGLLQTKGSLARMFVSLHFSDGQIDSGFNGHVTFELFNGSDFNIRILKNQPVGNLYIIKTSTKNQKMYSGRYSGYNEPTIQFPPEF